MKNLLPSENIIYEQPLNDAVRICLRLENLFEKIKRHRKTLTDSNSRMLIQVLLDMLNVIDRPDLKSKLTQTLMQQATSLNLLKRSPHVDQNELNHVLGQLNHYISAFHNLHTRMGDKLRNNEFLNMVRMQMNNPGGIMDFNSPLFALWVRQSSQEHHLHFSEWLQEFDLLKEVSELLLRLIRDSVEAKSVTALEGFYQQSLNASVAYQLMRVSLPVDMNLYPEMSIGKHRMSIRFLMPDFSKGGGRPQQHRQTIKFDLYCCRI